jgi:hypothetical protein
VVLPAVDTPPGDLRIVQLPLGKPLNTTLPVGVAHVGCVIAPTNGAAGLAITVKLLFDEHPVDVSVKVRVTVPALMPATTPTFVTAAIKLLLLNQVPPELGVTMAELPTHTSFAPPNTGKTGTTFMRTFVLEGDTQPLELAAVKV